MGMKISDAMTSNPCAIDADETVQYAAQMMRDEDVGFAPIVENDRMSLRHSCGSELTRQGISLP